MATTSAFLRPFVTEMSREGAGTDAPPIFLKTCAYSLLGSLLTRHDYRCILDEGVAGTWTNLWFLLIGDSGKDRKSTAIGMMEQVLKRIDQNLRGPDDMSPEGLARHLYGREQQNDDASSLIIQSEFINLLMQFNRQYSQVLRAMLLKWYDVEQYARQLKKEVFIIEEGRVSLLGGIPMDLLAQHGTPEDWVGGFFNRCMFITGDKERVQQNRPRVPGEVYDRLAANLAANLDRWKKVNEKRAKGGDWVRFRLSKKAEAVGKQLNDFPEYEGTTIATMLARAGTHFVKIAAIEQIDEDPTAPEVGEAAAKRALEFVKLWQKNVPMFVEHCMTRSRTDFEGDRLSKTIVRFLDKRKKQGALTQEVLYSCGLSSVHVKAALESLAEANMVERISDEDAGEFRWVLKSSPGLLK